MNNRCSHLVWLGAGTATECAEILDMAEKITLVDARETACLQLKKLYTQPNISIQQQLISVNAGNVLFTEYNLIEYSAISPITGLKVLFPGIQKTSSEQLISVAVTDFIQALLLEGKNNVLVMDIPDSNLDLLTSLRDNDQLKLFHNLQVHTAIDSLYKGSAKSSEIILFLEECGYFLQKTSTQDPELPWLTFAINPLYIDLKNTKQELADLQQTNEILIRERDKVQQDFSAQQKAKESTEQELERCKKDIGDQLQSKEILELELTKSKEELAKSNQKLVLHQQASERLNSELETTKQELTLQSQNKEMLLNELESIKKKFSILENSKGVAGDEIEKFKTESNKLQKTNELLTAENEKSKLEITKLQKVEHDQAKQLTKLQNDLEQVSKHASSRADKTAQLEKSNRQLHEKNEQMEKRQDALQQELLKAEAQIDVIKELLLKKIDILN